MVGKGKETIGNYHNVQLVFDWDDFGRYRGHLHERTTTEIAAGGLLIGLGVLGVVSGVVLAVMSGRAGELNFFWPKSALALVFWLGVLTILYGAFLRRDRNEFTFNLENKTLNQVPALVVRKSPSGIEVDDYFAFDIWDCLDGLVFGAPENFLYELSARLLALPENQVLALRLGLNITELQKSLPIELHSFSPHLSAHFPGLFTAAFLKGLELEKSLLDGQTLFLVLAQTIWRQALLEVGVTSEKLTALQVWLRNEQRKLNYRRLWERQSLLKPKGNMNRAYTARYTPTLLKYGENYTREAAKGNFSLSVGKDNEMTEVIKILQKENGSMLMLIGEPGVGKTRFLKHLAVRMVVEDVPKVLQDKRLIAFNFNRAFTEGQTLENFKVVLTNVLQEVAESKDIILVLDDIDQLLNIRADFQAEVVNLLTSMVDKYRLRVIGTTTADGYTRYIKPLRALSALFQTVYLKEPDPFISFQVLIDELPSLESKFGIKVQVSALEQVVNLAPKFAYERVMPDKAIDLLEEALIEAKEQKVAFLTGDMVSSVVSRKVGVKVGELTKTEAEVLSQMEDKMHTRVVGQDAAIKAVVAALKRARAGLTRASKPTASFLFFGPTGVGKTEVAKTLAESYYGDEKLMIRIDMSEYQEEENLQRLIGYVEGDKFIGGYLAEAVRKQPFSLVLLDEIEKANSKVLDLFLQVLDEGSLTDGSGRKVDFTNTILIATSNAGSREIADLISQGKPYNGVNETVQPILRQVFRIEFLNRFDKVIMFKPLLPHEVEEIARRLLVGLADKLLSKGIRLQFSQSVPQEIAQSGYNPVYGAREVKRVIQENVEDLVAEQIVLGQLVAGKTLKLNSLTDYQIT